MSKSVNLAIHFNQIANEFEQGIALSFPDGLEYTYQKLSDDSDQLASLLLAHGAGLSDVIAIAGVKRYYTYAAFLACLKIGAIYTFFDPKSPWPRCEKIFDRCNPKFIIGYLDKAQGIKDQSKYSIINFDGLDVLRDGRPNQRKKIAIDKIPGSHPAYIMFTSGSTGFPKGAVMSHQNVLNFIDWCQKTFDITDDDVHTNVNPLYFDNAVFDLYSTLFTGATLVSVNKHQALKPAVLLDILENKQCTSWFSVPFLLIYLQQSKAIIERKWQSVKKIIFGGEGYPKTQLYDLYQKLKKQTTFYNVYGPTECTCMCSSYTVSDNDFDEKNGLLPLGHIAEMFSYLIVGDNGKINKDKGELWLGGANVGLGYYNDPKKTKEKFVLASAETGAKSIFYKTGDIVSFNPQDQKIYFHGRKDNQIKHMGYRIELEEIEQTLKTLKNVKDVCVFSVNGSRNTKICVVIESEEQAQKETMKQALREKLPYFMIPEDFFFCDMIPRNANGKVDRLKTKEVYGKLCQK